MNVSPASYASAMHNAVINRARNVPLYCTGPASVNYEIDAETIKRACETPITVTHIASGDVWRKAINEARDHANAQQIWQEPTHV